MWRYIGINDLCHYGIKGMRWGVHRTKEQLQYNRNSIQASILRKSGIITTSVGTVIKSISGHALDRIENNNDRKVGAKDILGALTKPLHVDTIKYDKYGRKSQRYIGAKATVNVNPDTG